MKNLVLLIVVAMICSTVDAQLISSKIITKKKEVSGSGMILELGIGSLGGSISDDNGNSDNIKGDGVSIDFGLGYRKAFTPYIAWDIVKLRAFGQISDFGSTFTPQLLTSLRGTSPVLFANAKIYADFGLGYGYVIDPDAGGLCYEFQAGLDITPNFYLGLVYSAQKFSVDDYYKLNYNVTFTGLRIGFKF
ncbi:MAG: hypothetical protein FWD60_07270 [Candidatus Azobacteroides sp.]|nr:hypothetical protein [Candidatus Azobacteroides sp.]